MGRSFPASIIFSICPWSQFSSASFVLKQAEVIVCMTRICDRFTEWCLNLLGFISLPTVCPDSVCFLATLWMGPRNTSGIFFLCGYSSSQRNLFYSQWKATQPCCRHTLALLSPVPAGDVVRLPEHEITSSTATPWKPKCCLVTYSWKYQKHFSICHVGKKHWLLDLEAFCCA